MSAEECLRLHGEERGVLLHKYRYALDQALAQAGWMTTQDIVVLQAITLLIVGSGTFLSQVILGCLTNDARFVLPTKILVLLGC